MPTASDEPHFLIMMQSLAGDHDLQLRDEYDDIAAYQPPSTTTRLPPATSSTSGSRNTRSATSACRYSEPFRSRSAAALACSRSSAWWPPRWSRSSDLACRNLGIAHRPALLAVSAATLAHPFLSDTRLADRSRHRPRHRVLRAATGLPPERRDPRAPQHRGRAAVRGARVAPRVPQLPDVGWFMPSANFYLISDQQ